MPRDQTHPGDQPDEHPPVYSVLTDKPGVYAVDLVRRVRVVAVLFCATLAAATIAGSYVATTIAGRQSEDRVEKTARELLADMDRRTADRKRNEVQATAVLEQNRRTLCSLMRDLRERGQSNTEVDTLYRVYTCGTAKNPVVPPGWTPPPGWPSLPGAKPAPEPSTPAPNTPYPTPAPPVTP